MALRRNENGKLILGLNNEIESTVSFLESFDEEKSLQMK